MRRGLQFDVLRRRLTTGALGTAGAASEFRSSTNLLVLTLRGWLPRSLPWSPRFAYFVPDICENGKRTLRWRAVPKTHVFGTITGCSMIGIIVGVHTKG